MYLTRKERDKIEELCLCLYGTKSVWQKLIKSYEFKIPFGEPVKKKFKNYLIVGKGRGKKTQISVTKAKALGLIGEEEKEYFEKEVYNFRAPNPDELTNMLKSLFDSQSLQLFRQTGDGDELRFLYAYRLIKGELAYSFGLTKTLTAVSPEDSSDVAKAADAMMRARESYDSEFNQVLSEIGDEKVVDAIKDAVVEKKVYEKIGGFEAVDFAMDVRDIVVGSDDEAEAEYNRIMKEVRNNFVRRNESTRHLAAN